MPTKLRIAIAVGLCSLSVACAAQITVGPSGQYQTIHEGVAAANAGDTVLVQPGYYTDNITITVPITLIAQACQGLPAMRTGRVVHGQVSVMGPGHLAEGTEVSVNQPGLAVNQLGRPDAFADLVGI